MLNIIKLLNDPTVLMAFAGFFIIFLFCFGLLQLHRQLIAKKEIMNSNTTIFLMSNVLNVTD